VASPRAADPREIRAGADDYPRGLRDLADVPGVLHVLGGPLPPLERAVAIVGARAASPYGLEVAGRLAADLARLGYEIVSGLARGIDAAAHTGALEAGGRTVAVLPGGLDRITPTHHVDLAQRIRTAGALVTEHAPGTRVFPGSFLRRNRLIAAMSAATVVVEAAERSGALSTAAAARHLGRRLLAVPGDVDREASRGCNALIREGAILCRGVTDVLSALEDPADKKREGARVTAGIATTLPVPSLRVRSGSRLSDDGHPITIATRVLRGLSTRPQLVEVIAATADLAVPETLAALLTLQWSGVATSHPGQRWSRR
jgi:DNA processing protein